jgi:hypothetical protein
VLDRREPTGRHEVVLHLGAVASATLSNLENQEDRLVAFDELNGLYQRLRSELDAAYARPVWNSSKIDQIAEKLAQVELALASAEHGTQPARSAAPARSSSLTGQA